MSAWVAVVSTAYCLTGTMADGTWTREASVASNHYRLGTVLEVRPSPTGQRLWMVRDRIGWGTELDFWRPSCWSARAWGRRTVRIRPHRPRPWRIRRLREATQEAIHAAHAAQVGLRDAVQAALSHQHQDQGQGGAGLRGAPVHQGQLLHGA